ncbi:MAG: CapA family protein [Solirubrobacterales bacterium]|nr:CapA family protein [Solirubrobacterales bacterium]
MSIARVAVAAAASVVMAAPGVAGAQTPQLSIEGPAVRAPGVEIAVVVRGAPPGAPVHLEHRTPRSWVVVATGVAAGDGTVRLRYRPHRPRARHPLRAAAPGALPSRTLDVRTRAVTLAAFGDANFGDGVATVMARRGDLWPWRDVAPVLRRADVAFGNLECAISRRGAPVAKEFRFRGRPGALRRVVRFAGLDVLNLANNHVGDYGTAALLDTVRHVRRSGALPVGAGATLAAARRPAVTTRLGLRIAFVGFSDIGPGSFAAGLRRPGTAFATLPVIRAGVREAARRADVVVATFHWGVERARQENARQRAFARAAISSGATAVIGAHPHVLQPIRRPARRRLIAYSLGNFVWAAGSALTSSTGILHLRLSTRGVESARLQRGRILGTRPRVRLR